MNKEDKAGNPILILFIFIVLIGFLYVIPEIYKKYNTEIADFLGIGNNIDKDVIDNNDEEKMSISEYYQIGSKNTLEFNELLLTNISLDNNILTFTVNVKDATDESQNTDLQKLNYYIEFYESKKTFIGRRTLKGNVITSQTINIDISNLNINTSTYFVLSHISDDAIGGSEIESDENGISKITCVKNSETYEYQFYLKKLTKSTYNFNYTNSDLNAYASELLNYKKKEKAYNEFNGVTAKIVENENAFVFISEFDYTNIPSFSSIGDNNIFDKDTYNNVIKFKMEAEGFDCRWMINYSLQ